MKIYFINTDRNVKFVKGKLINNMRECLQIRVPDDIRGQEIYTATSKEEAVKKYIQEFPHVKEWAEKNDLPLTGAIENNVISVSEIHRRF